MNPKLRHGAVRSRVKCWWMEDGGADSSGAGTPEQTPTKPLYSRMSRAVFDLQSPFQPAGDQPKAIAELSAGLQRGDRFQTLLGVTGSGKTMSVAHVIRDHGRPTLVMSHNKTLAAQLYGEFKS